MRLAVITRRPAPSIEAFKKVQDIPGAFPPISTPDFSIETLQKLFSAALIMTLLASTEAMAIARAMALKTKDNFNANQEFIGQGYCKELKVKFKPFYKLRQSAK